MDKRPIVSVIVLSYNSSATITETLDSIFSQDYDNVELVISDDCSKDNTVEVAKDWVSSHKDRFICCKINDRGQNGGVPANLNSAIKMCDGKYIKIIAADDLLTENCISKNVEICLKNEYRHLCTWLKKFSVDADGNKKFWDVEYICPSNDSTAQEQYNTLLVGNTVYGSIFFAEKAFIEEMGMYDENYPLIEDYPMWIKMTRNGFKLNFENTVTVLYRISDASLSNFVGDSVVNQRYIECYSKFLKKEIIPALFKKRRFIPAINHLRAIFYYKLFIVLGNSRKKRSVRIAEYFFKRKYLKKKNLTN